MSAGYGWIITRDLIDDDEGVTGPSLVSQEIGSRLGAGEGRAFRMRDDDGEIYYYGRYLGPDDERLFGPLDDFGMPNAGCTSIEYKHATLDQWETI